MADTPDDAGRETKVPDQCTVDLRSDRASSGTHLGTADRFRVDEEIGRGGMGRVVEAFDKELGRTVAIKEVAADDPATLARFEREIRITARLQHPAIVPLYDAGYTATGTPYYVMRRIAGRTLHERITACRTLDERLVLLPSFLAAADAIAYAHERGVIHRDLTPRNIVLGEHGETVVIDWGLAKQLDEPESAPPVSAPASSGLTAAGAVFGTPGFMAPEQVRGELADRRSDVFALGASLHRILVDKMPKPGASALPGGVPRDLATIVDKAIAADPAARYPDASRFAQDLRRFLEGRLVAAHRYSLRDRVTRFVRRHAIAMSVSALAALALVVTIAIAAGRVLAERDRAQRGWGEARQRQEELVIANAEALLGSDPTRAALVAASLPLASPHWPRARSILADARARGIVRMLQGTGDYIYAMQLDRAEQRLVVLDRAGTVMLHDLAAHTSRQLARVDKASDIAWVGDSAIAIATPDRIRLLRPDGATAQELATAGRPTLAAPSDAGFLAWRDDKGVYVRRGEAPAQRIAELAAQGDIAVSRDGTWLAVFGRHERLRLFRADGSEVELPQVDAPNVVAFDDAGKRLAAVVGDTKIVELDLEARPPREHASWSVIHPGLVAYAGRTLFASTLDKEVLVLWKDLAPRVPAATSQYPRALGAVAEDVVAATPGDNSVVLVDGTQAVHVLRAPSEPLHAVSVSRNRNLIVAGGSRGSVVVWNVSDLFVPRLPDAGQQLTVALSDGLVLCALRQCSRTWFGTTRALSFGAFPAQIYPPYTWLSPAEALAIMGDLAGNLVAARFADGALERFGDKHVTALAFAAPDTVACIVDGTVELRHPFGGRAPEQLASLPASSLAIAASERVVAVALAGGGLWRRDLRTGATAEVHAGTTPTAALAVTPDGDVIAGVDTRIVRWRGGDVTVVASFGSPIVALAFDPGLGITALSRERVVHHIALSGGVRSTPLPPGDAPSLARRGAAAILLDATHAVVRVDAVLGTTRTLGQPGATGVAVGPAGDIAVQRAGGGIEIYRDDLPHAPADLVAWLRGATNGTLDPDLATIRWR